MLDATDPVERLKCLRKVGRYGRFDLGQGSVERGSVGIKSPADGRAATGADFVGERNVFRKLRSDVLEGTEDLNVVLDGELAVVIVEVQDGLCGYRQGLEVIGGDYAERGAGAIERKEEIGVLVVGEVVYHGAISKNDVVRLDSVEGETPHATGVAEPSEPSVASDSDPRTISSSYQRGRVSSKQKMH